VTTHTLQTGCRAAERRRFPCPWPVQHAQVANSGLGWHGSNPSAVSKSTRAIDSLSLPYSLLIYAKRTHHGFNTRIISITVRGKKNYSARVGSACARFFDRPERGPQSARFWVWGGRKGSGSTRTIRTHLVPVATGWRTLESRPVAPGGGTKFRSNSWSGSEYHLLPQVSLIVILAFKICS
jgi:hypothetical protein